MAHHDYLIRYSNGFKRHVSRQERDLLLASLQQIGPREYLSNASLQITIEQTNGPCYLEGQFIFELKGRKQRDLMQTERGLLKQLESMGWQPEQVNP